MKTKQLLLLSALIATIGCNNSSSSGDVASSAASSQEAYPSVTAKIDGADWKSVEDDIFTTYDSFGDKLQIFTTDTKGKMNFLLILADFSKKGIGTYNSVQEGAGGFGISLLDQDKTDNIENDYDNFHQGAVDNCITITAMEETKDGKIVKGTFASPMNVSNNYDFTKDKGVVVTDGKFAVFVKK